MQGAIEKDGKRRVVSVIFRTQMATSDAADDEDAEELAVEGAGRELIKAVEEERYDLFTVSALTISVDGVPAHAGKTPEQVKEATDRKQLLVGHVLIPFKDILELEAVRDFIAQRFCGTFLDAMSCSVVETTENDLIIEVAGRP